MSSIKFKKKKSQYYLHHNCCRTEFNNLSGDSHTFLLLMNFFSPTQSSAILTSFIMAITDTEPSHLEFFHPYLLHEQIGEDFYPNKCFGILVIFSFSFFRPALLIFFRANFRCLKDQITLYLDLPLAVIYVRTERTMGENEKSCVTDS